MTELAAVLVIAVLALLQHRADQRRLDDAFHQLTLATRQIRAQADPATFAWVGDEPSSFVDPIDAFEQRYLTDASGLCSVPLDDDGGY